MKLKKILGKTVALTKEIKLRKPNNGSGLVARFSPGDNKAYSPFSTIGFEWWNTKRSFTLYREIAEMAISFNPDLRARSIDDLSCTIRTTIQKNALNKDLFDSNAIFCQSKETLFDARSISKVEEFSSHLWDVIHRSMLHSIMNWLVLYPLSRIYSDSVKIGYDGLSLLNADDKQTWQKLTLRYPSTKYWNPSTGQNRDGKDNLHFFDKLPSTWLVCEILGTRSGARSKAGYLIRTFIAVLFSYLDNKNFNIFLKSMAHPKSYSVQFPADSSRAGCSQEIAYIGTLLQPLLIDIRVSGGLIANVKEWYKFRYSAQKDIANRATIGSHFIQYALVADDLEQFIHFFIALDALFGERNKVEERIIEGLKKLFQDDQKWVDRARKLFELRSDLVHGGSSSIRDWKGLKHYRRYFHSDPSVDVRLAATKALKQYFKIRVE